LKLALITRPEAQSAALAARLVEKGYEPVIAPLFEVSSRSVAVPPGVQAILVTSGNSLAALPVVDRPIFAVGDATAERARGLGFRTIYSAGADATALAGLVAARLNPVDGAVFLASGAGQGFGLASDLRGRGFRVVRRVCYEARPVRRLPRAAELAIRSGELGVVLFLSAETALTFVRLLPSECAPALASVIAVAIGKTTADALHELPWLMICRARNPTLDDVLALI
jgi:uroporphyrinogen-III synthase